MELGAFSISLAVKDIEASRRFSEKFGFKVFAGNAAHGTGHNDPISRQGVLPMKHVLPLLAFSLLGPVLRAENPKEFLNVPYGPHARQVLDFYQAKSDKPTPVVFSIHGGGWSNGDKKMNPKPFLDKGISVAAINYRFV